MLVSDERENSEAEKVDLKPDSAERIRRTIEGVIGVPATER